MPRSEFVHLHLHTQYSLLDGACRIPRVLELCQKYNMDSLAITDHGNMFGAIEFYIEAISHGVKPIIGCEVYIAPGSRFEKNSSGIEEASYHFILLAKDEIGYRNLMKLVSLGYLEGFYYRPRIDKDILTQYKEGLIGLSGCIKGEIPLLLQQERFNDALKAADDFLNILGRGNFYLEIQENNLKEQKITNEGLIKISRELDIPLVATNDVHYLIKEDARPHEILLCIQTQTTLNDPNRLRFQTDEFYFKSPQQMKEIFKDLPQAINNTLEIAQRCNLELDFSKIHLPKYDPPNGQTKEEFLRQLCEKGLKERYSQITEEIKQRLEYELKVIKDMGFISYFLIVWDFVNYARRNNIPVGPGRGSAAGSLVSYLLGITDIDPLKYKLLFERFLNPERQSLPDIDIDFCYENRQRVIDYVTSKYGRENVAQIITFGTMQARAVVRDVGRVMGMSYSEVDKIAKMIPPDPNINLKNALESEPQLNQLYKNDSQIKQLIDTALVLEGLNRHASIHAAGVVIADKPLDNYMPLFKTSDDQITTGYSMEILEKIGLLKVDFLGLRTLTVIEETLKLIKQRRGIAIDIRNIPLDDSLTYKLLSSGQTIGVFQLESAGMRDLLKKLQPSVFEDLIAILALYRPGPIGAGMVEDFIQRKHGRHPIKYDHKKLEPILKDTYGIIVYQEQIMQIASSLAGFSLAQADLLRRAMSKKIPEVMERQRQDFIKGCVKNGIREEIANKIFNQIDYFSGYGFNRSHSAAYAVISYRTAYLKANFPVEFMTALLNSERDNTDKIVEYVNEANRMGIKILPPDINESDIFFKIIDEQTIRFGLIAIKNVGSTAIESILQARTNKKFSSLEDLCQRVDNRLVNKKVLESLIKSGAFDCFGKKRAEMFANLEKIIEYCAKISREKQKGQISLFDDSLNSLSLPTNTDNYSSIKEWPEPQLLAFEKEVLGFYVSGHPLTQYVSELKRFNIFSISKLSECEEDKEVTIVGLISKLKQTLTRSKQERMAIILLEDLEGVVEALIFPTVYQKANRSLQEGRVVMVKGRVTLKEDTPKIIASDLYPLEDVYKLITGININLSGIKDNLFESLKEILFSFPGNVPIYLNISTPQRKSLRLVVGESFFVKPCSELIQSIEALLGEERVSFMF